MPFQKELKRLGLKDKEAAVYLACLELGPSPVQVISRKASVVRATTYVVLESLSRRGLVTQYKEGKKTLFSAEPPRQLMRLLEKNEEEIAEKKHRLELLLPELQMIVKSGEGQPTVRYFDGIEGLRAMRREMLMQTERGDMWHSFSPLDHLDAIFDTADEALYIKQRVAKQVKTRAILSTKSESLRRKLAVDAVTDLSERRFLPPDEFPIASGMTIYGNRIAIGSFTGKIGGVIIESEEIANMLKRLFNLAWESAERT